MRRLWERQGRWLVTIVAFVALAIVVGGYLVSQQRLRLPFTDRYEIEVAFPSVQSLTPDTSQPVAVAGVRVGEVTAVRLDGGRPVARLAIDPDRLPRVHADARATLVPLTPLKNMEVELDPGSPGAPVLPEGGRITVARTSTTADVDQVLAALDGDARLAVEQLLQTVARGLDDRGETLGAALRALGPTTAQARRITSALGDRSRTVRRLVGDLTALSRTAAGEGERLGGLTDDLGETLAALAEQDTALRAGVRALPAVLGDASASIDRTAALLRTARRTATTLRPALRRLPALSRDAGALLRRTEPFLRDDVRPLVRRAVPVARDAGPVLAQIEGLVPPARRIVAALSYGFNELAADPGDGRKGYLYWGSWFFHNANSMLSTADASGAAWRLLPLLSCSSFGSEPALQASLGALAGLAGGCER